MLTFLAIHVGSILLLLVWMVLESLVRRGNIDIFEPLATEAYKQGLRPGAMWATILFLPELVIVVAILKIIVGLLRVILE